MLRLMVYTVSFVGLLAGMIMGMFAAVGLCAAIFGGEIVDTVLSAKPEPNRTHPAFILFISATVPGMLVGAVGAIFGIVIPVHQRFQISLGMGSESTRILLHEYAKRLLSFTEKKSANKTDMATANKPLC